MALLVHPRGAGATKSFGMVSAAEGFSPRYLENKQERYPDFRAGCARAFAPRFQRDVCNMTTRSEAPTFSIPSNMPHTAWGPRGSTGLPSRRNHLDESKPAHSDTIAHTAHQITGRSENLRWRETESGLTVKKSTAHGTSTSRISKTRLAIAPARGSTVPLGSAIFFDNPMLSMSIGFCRARN